MLETFAVYQQPDGALCVLSIAPAADQMPTKVSGDFLSYGRALVEKQKLERAFSNGGAN